MASSFHDLPEELRIAILSFLSPAELQPFAATSRCSLSLCFNPSLWFSLCLRRWGAHTLISRWSPPSPRLYHALSSWSNLIGFWRQIAQTLSPVDHATPLVFFEWFPSFILASRLAPSSSPSFSVAKIPFLWLGMDPAGRPVCFAHRRGRLSPSDVSRSISGRLHLKDPDLVPVEFGFVCGSHFVLEEQESFASGDASHDELATLESSSSPDRPMSEIYQFIANPTSPGSESSSRRRRLRRRRKRLEPEHYVKIADCSPTPSRPLQGLWKGIGEDMKLGFYLVTYHKSGVISCQRVVEDLYAQANAPLFWTTDSNFIDYPFPCEEVDIYHRSFHINRPTSSDRTVTKIRGICSDYDSVTHVHTGSSSSGFHNVEGRLWQYKNGSFGFGFLENGYIIDLTQVAMNRQLLDALESL